MASMWTLLISVLAIVVVASTGDTFPPQAFPPQAPRMLKRARKRTDRTRIATLNCRTLLAEETLDDLDVTLSKIISISVLCKKGVAMDS